MEKISYHTRREIEQLRAQAKTAEEYRKIIIIIMWIEGYSASDISRILGISRATFYKWVGRYKKKGTSAFLEKKKRGRPPKITRREKEYLRKLLLIPPANFGYKKNRWTLSLLRDRLAKEKGITISIEHVRRLLKQF